MIQIYKLSETNEKILDNLQKVSPWWNKSINKKIYKAKKFIQKFGLQPDDYIKFSKIEEIGLIELIKAVNNYLNFYTPKLKIIVSNKDAFKKFDDSIINYMNLNGSVSAIQTIALFYDHIKDDEANSLTKNNALEFANKIIEEKWNRYKKEILTAFGHNDLVNKRLHKLFDEVIEFKANLFDTRIILGWIVKYAGRLFKIKEISEKQFLNIMYLSYLQLSYNESFINVFNKFLLNLRK